MTWDPYATCPNCGTQTVYPVRVGDDALCPPCADRGVHRCGLPTKRGRPCQRFIRNPNGCPLHRRYLRDLVVP